MARFLSTVVGDTGEDEETMMSDEEVKLKPEWEGDAWRWVSEWYE